MNLNKVACMDSVIVTVFEKNWGNGRLYPSIDTVHSETQIYSKSWPSEIGSRLGQNRLWVRFLAVSDVYPMFIELAITCVPSAFRVLWVHMAWHKNCKSSDQFPAISHWVCSLSNKTSSYFDNLLLLIITFIFQNKKSLADINRLIHEATAALNITKKSYQVLNTVLPCMLYAV